jgi:glycosyl transferase family 87
MEAVATRDDRHDPLKNALTHGLGFWAIVAPVWVLVTAALGGNFALDFHYAYLRAAHAVAHGASPYGSLSAWALAHEPFIYPPLSAYLFVPFTLLPTGVAEVVAVLLVAAAVPATLLVLGVRDWRCHAIAFLWWPIIIAIQTANVTLPLLLGLALVWRYRDRRVIAGLMCGFVIALKLFFWPVLVWLVATRRYRTAAVAAAASALLVFLPWAGIGFAGLRGYPHLLSTVSNREGPGGYSIAALLHTVLPSWTADTALETLVGVAVLALVLVVGRRGRDRDAFALAILAILVLSPLLEMHYVSLLLVLVALYRREFGLAWVMPLFIWGASANAAGSPGQVVHVLVVVAATCAAAYWNPQPQTLMRALRSGRRKPADPAPLSY